LGWKIAKNMSTQNLWGSTQWSKIAPLVDPVALQFALWPHPPVTVRCIQDRNHRRRDVPLSTVALSWICLMLSHAVAGWSDGSAIAVWWNPKVFVYKFMLYIVVLSCRSLEWDYHGLVVCWSPASTKSWLRVLPTAIVVKRIYQWTCAISELQSCQVQSKHGE
jgi:hypothetical protein